VSPHQKEEIHCVVKLSNEYPYYKEPEKYKIYGTCVADPDPGSAAFLLPGSGMNFAFPFCSKLALLNP
jgi:hypothetical protein